MTHAVQRTKELTRILGLPRRRWVDAHATEIAERLTQSLRTPDGTMTLRPIQAMALAELDIIGGLFGAIGVGHGKTILSLLAATVLGAKRPLILIPAKLRDKTYRELRVLARHWRIVPATRIESYELLGRADHADLIATWSPDLLVCDEAHRLKNPRAAVTRRVFRALENPQCRLVAMSGTITSRSLRDYAHIVKRCLGTGHTPLPESWTELEEWADALDETKNESRTVDVGALSLLVDPANANGDTDPLARARRGYRDRLVSTPGVIATDEGTLGVSLSITAARPPVPSEVRDALAHLRATAELPDGTPLADGMAIWRHTRELALGFYYRWDPAPPRDWLAARKAWCAACRQVLSTNRRNLDSELQVVRAVDAGQYPQLTPILAAWRAVKDTFKPNTVPVWLTDSVRAWVLERASRDPMIVWVEHVAFGRALGLPYYGQNGEDEGGRVIEDAPNDRSIAASIASNSEGRNLQAWSRNLVTSPPAGGRAWEQMLGRTHRAGQTSDEVTCELLVTCPEHEQAFAQACADARYVQDSTGSPQKLLYADVMIARAAA